MIIHRVANRLERRKRKVAAYCRVSTDMASQAESLDTQVTVYTQMIAENDSWEFAGIYADEGKTGTNTNRPGYQQMMEDALSGKIDLILVKSISRFSRNVVDCHQSVRQLKEKDVEVLFEREGISSMDPSSDLIFSLLAAIAQDESRSISENVKWTVRKNFEKGIFRLGNNRVLGYDTDASGKLIPNRDAWMVRMAFDLFCAHKTYSEIAELITKAGGHCLRSEKPLAAATIQAVLQNDIYVGDRRLGKTAPINFLTKRPDPNAASQSYYYADVHEPIIDRGTWNRAQALLAQRRQEIGQGILRKGRDNHFLFGKVFCGSCGAPYTRRTFRSSARREPVTHYKAWNCKERQKGKRGNDCKNPTIQEKQLLKLISEQLGWPWVDEEHFDIEEFQRIVRRIEVNRNGLILYRNGHT